MKILTSKKVKELFDNIVTLSLIADEALEAQALGHKTDTAVLLNRQSVVVENMTNAVYALRGMYGLRVAQSIHERHQTMSRSAMMKCSLNTDNPKVTELYNKILNK